MIFNERMRILRNEAGLTQQDMAKALGLGHRNYCRMESDGGKPQFDNLIKIATYFGVSLDWLVGRTDRREINR